MKPSVHVLGNDHGLPLGEITEFLPSLFGEQGAYFVPPRPSGSQGIEIQIPTVDHLFCVTPQRMKEMTAEYAQRRKLVLRDKDTRRIKRECAESHVVFAFVDRAENLAIPEVELQSNARCIVLCPANVERYVDTLVTEDIFKHLNLGAQQFRELVYKVIIYHEIGHYVLDPSLLLDDVRLHEGFANFFTFSCVAPLEQRMVDWVALSQDLEYNYFYFMKFMDFTPIFSRIVSKDSSGAISQFYDNFMGSHLQEACGGTLRVGGSIGGFVGFGASGCTITCCNEIEIVCNCVSSRIAAGSIGRLEGYVRRDVNIITNAISSRGVYTNLPSLPPNVRILDKSELDLRAFLAGLQDISALDSLWKAR